ncbi:MAG: class I SAM-dependent methyltransferase [Candidatus Sumerlaeota bacterium]|nr:class I SAM-dependent methyltransferase [Candidatus Sumerlaeota bacterium]
MTRQSKTYYEPARWYDLRDFSQLRDVEFFLTIAEQYGPRLLECGAGTGRIAIPLAQAGYNIVGMDRDEAMLRRARQKWKAAEGQAKGKLKLIKADMTDFTLRRKFDMAFVAFNAFLTLAALEQREAMLRCVRRHLTDEGRLIIDVSHPSSIMFSGDQPERLDFTIEDQEMGTLVRRYSWSRRDMSTQQIQMCFEYRWTTPDGERRKDTSAFPMCVIFPVEMQLLLMKNGYDVETIHGNHERAPFNKHSSRMIFVARRRNREKPR